jgi:hypothetical protein
MYLSLISSIKNGEIDYPFRFHVFILESVIVTLFIHTAADIIALLQSGFYVRPWSPSLIVIHF